MTPNFQAHTLTPVFQPPDYDPKTAVMADFGRLIHAAVINSNFRQNLLNNPLACIESGYCGERFDYSPELKERIRLIHAGSLEEFSKQLLQIMEPSYTHTHKLSISNYH
jgi:hypothetical protein